MKKNKIQASIVPLIHGNKKNITKQSSTAFYQELPAAVGVMLEQRHGQGVERVGAGGRRTIV